MVNTKAVENQIGLVILSIIILLSLSELLEISIDLNYITKIILWCGFGFLLYKASITRLFFGTTNKIIDALTIISYYFMILKDMISYIKQDITKNPIFEEFYQLVLTHTIAIEQTGLIIGGGALLLISLFLTFDFRIQAPSLAAALLQEPNNKGLFSYAKRFCVFFIILCSFFVIFFNLVVQWLGVSVFSYVMVIFLMGYTELVHHHHHKFHPDHIIYKMGTAGEGFYEQFIQLFHTKQTLPLAIMGLLVLHLVTDIGSFIIPYAANLTGFLHDFGPSHESIYTLAVEDISGTTLWETVNIIFGYAANIASLFMLLASPAILWYIFFKRKDVALHQGFAPFFLSLVLIFLVFPIFSISTLESENFVGVDITSHSLEGSLFFIIPLFIFGFVFFYLLSHTLHNFLTKILIITVLLFVVSYVYLYFVSIISYYLGALAFLFSSQLYFLLIYFSLFFIITVAFYLSSIILFAHDVFKRKLYKHIS